MRARALRGPVNCSSCGRLN